jgi:hypothetical protein
LVRPLKDKSLLSIKDATYFQLLHVVQTACAEAKTTDNETKADTEVLRRKTLTLKPMSLG